ncbi:MAG: exo-alpha-sialidase [Gammaproteobacteria bacterium]|nr:exo-alpha-sialidase [Gammaproteobacteria bacterium]
MSKKTDGRWQPLKLAPFSGTYNDFEPMFSGDGSQLWFSSDRPRYSGDQRKDWDLWYMNVTYNSDSLSFTKPVNPGSPVNTEEDEYYPSVAANGNLYFTATRKAGPGKEDIYVAQRNGDMYQTVVPLGKGVNSTTYEFNAYVAPDESYLIFSSFQRADDLGRGDLYISFRNTKGIYEEAISLGDKINSSALDYCPFVFEGRLYFSSDRYFDPGNYERTSELEQWLTSPGNGLGDIYSIPFHPEKQLSAK